MEERYQSRDPREIVECYCRPEHREVVETYSRPLPAGMTEHAASPAPPPVRKKKKTGLWIFLGCFAALALLAAAAIAAQHFFRAPEAEQKTEPGFPDVPDMNWWENETPAEITIPPFPYGQGAELPVLTEHGDPIPPQEVYRQVNPAVVQVVTYRENGGGMGSGVIFTQDGYVLTNHHVVAGAAECYAVLADGSSYDACYVAGDADYDLAVLKLDAEGLPTAVFGDSDLLVVGDPVYAIGNPLNYELVGTMTDGIVSAVDREVDVDGVLMTLIQTNAALNEGNSGGPLINQYGQVVGINVIKMDSITTTVEGLGFAIPSSVMDRVVNDLLTHGTSIPEPLLGLSVLRVGEEIEPGLFGLPVQEVTPGGAADRAGIRAGDYVVSADGMPLMTSQDLLRVRRDHYTGDRLPVTVWREGTLTETVLDLQESVED